jgi:Lrp/AsnC family transcriptional regulator, leucine-responsive regulatory protein
MTMELDHYDNRILALLQNDARLTMAELSRQIKLSQPAVTERVRKLEVAGIITGYHAKVNTEKLGFGIRAMVRIGRSDYNKVKKLLEKTPEVRNAHNVVAAGVILDHVAEVKVDHLWEDGGFEAADVHAGANSGNTSFIAPRAQHT